MVARIRDAELEEVGALEELQRRSSGVWEAYRDQLAANPDAIALPPAAVRERRVRVAEDEEGRRVGFSVVLPVRGGACELDGLFVEPDVMRRGVGGELVDDAVRAARHAGARYLDVTAGPEGIGFYEKVGFRCGEPTGTRFGPAWRLRLRLVSDISAAKLAAALASGLRALLPREFDLSVSGPKLRLAPRGTPYWTQVDTGWMLDQCGSEQGLCAASENVLGNLQDLVAEWQAEPWPEVAPAPMPMPFARIEGDDLVVGFEPHPVVARIALADLL